MAIFGSFHMGIGKSRADQNGFDSAVNVDVHSEIGYLKPQLALALESATPTEPTISAVAPSGTVYLFSTTSGKIWKRTTAGVYSSITDNVNTAHTGAYHFNGYMWYWTSSKLGFFIADTEASRNDSFGTFTNSSAQGCGEVNGSLHICDGKYMAGIDSANTFSPNVLDFPSNMISTIATKVGSDLLIGTYQGSNVQSCTFYLWDTYSPSWTTEDDIPEKTPNCFIDGDNVRIACCGDTGALYYWNGGQMVSFDNRLRNVTTSISPFASCVYNKRPTYAVGNKLFTIYKQFESLPFAIVQEYTSTGTTVSSLIATGNQLLVSHGSGVDKVGTDYATGYIDTPEVTGQTSNQVIVDHDAYGAGVGISTQSNRAGYVSQTTVVDDLRSQVFFDGGLPDSVTTQARITLTPSGANLPIIKSISIE